MLKPYFQEEFSEAGLDEAGRGCYAGPVFAAAVMLSKDFHHPLINDSKKLLASQRETLRTYIEENALCYAVASVDNNEIDEINILKASFKAMHLALDALNVKPGMLLIDGNRFTAWKKTPHQCIVKGDGLYASIAAASILAKTYRDEYMNGIHEEFPQYGWAQNKGYGTTAHRNAIEEYGLCIYHRKSFNIAPVQLKINF